MWDIYEGSPKDKARVLGNKLLTDTVGGSSVPASKDLILKLMGGSIDWHPKFTNIKGGKGGGGSTDTRYIKPKEITPGDREALPPADEPVVDKPVVPASGERPPEPGPNPFPYVAANYVPKTAPKEERERYEYEFAEYQKWIQRKNAYNNWVKKQKELANAYTGAHFGSATQAIVGERGPEILNLPGGSYVQPNHTLMNTMRQGSGTSTTVETKTIVKQPIEVKIGEREFKRLVLEIVNDEIRHKVPQLSEF